MILMKEALIIFNDYDDPQGQSAVYRAMGQWHHKKKNYNAAITAYQDALRLTKEIYGDSDREVAKIYLEMGLSYEKSQETDDAITSYQLALSSLLPDSKGVPESKELYPERLIAIVLDRLALTYIEKYKERNTTSVSGAICSAL